MPLFNFIDTEIQDTMVYLFEGLFKELKNLNKLSIRSIAKQKTSDGRSLLNCLIIDLSPLFENIYKDESLQLLLPLEIGEMITSWKISAIKLEDQIKNEKLHENKPVVQSLIDLYIPNSDIKTRQKCYEYYTKFINIYCAMIQLLESTPLINDFYTFIKNNKVNIYNEQDSDYDKVLKTVFYYINSKTQFFKGNIKDTSVSNLTTKFNNFTKQETNKSFASLMERLTSTLSICICYNEN